MGEIALQVKVANQRIAEATASATREIMKQAVVINELRKVCNHNFRFHSQTNAYHEHLWNVTYQCSECELTTTTKIPPVCEACLVTLVRAKKGDRQAAREAKNKEGDDHLGNPPLAFRCPKCKKIHILWHEGDSITRQQ